MPSGHDDLLHLQMLDLQARFVSPAVPAKHTSNVDVEAPLTDLIGLPTTCALEGP